MTKYLSEEEALQVIQAIRDSGKEFSYDFKKHKITIPDDNGEDAVQLRLPITVPFKESITLPEDTTINYIILLIQSGSSAVGYCEGDEMVDHKVFKSYMVRKKQGKSQIKYLKTKGKSKAGSRVRLGNALGFFEDINERLQEYFEENTIDRIALSCSKTLIPFLFNSKVECPFDKKDERIFKIPIHIHTPGYDVLLETHNFLQKGELSYQETHQGFVDGLFEDSDEGEI